MQNPLPSIITQIEFLKESHEKLVFLSRDMYCHIDILREIISGADKCRLRDQGIQEWFEDLNDSMVCLNKVSEIFKKSAERFEFLHSRFLDSSELIMIYE